MDLRAVIDRETYRGILALSDIHGEIDALLHAVDYAVENDLFVVFLGDLVDGSEFPFEVVELTKDMLDSGRAAAVIGNHEEKFYRWSLGNPVKLGKAQLKTLDWVGEERESDFKTNIQAVVTHPRAEHYLYHGNTIFAHGGVHRSLWEFPDVLPSKAKVLSLYGEVDGSVDESGFPIRTYAWVEDIPPGCTAMVGHDRGAMGKSNEEQKVVANSQGGTVYFTDTSCGKKDKAPNGFLTGSMFIFVDDEIDFVKFVPFAGD